MPTTTNTRNASTSNSTPPVNVWDQRELGCMWLKTKKGSDEKYMKGTLNLKNVPGFPDQDVQFVVFKNKRKLNDSHPDLRVYVSEKRESTQATVPTTPAPASKRATPAPAPVTVPDSSNELI